MIVSLRMLLHTLWVWISFAVLILLMSIPTLCAVCIPEKYLVANRFFMALARFFHWYCTHLFGVTIEYRGILPDRPCIVAANHQSSFDIPLIGYALRGRPTIWMAWDKLHQMPLLRPILKRVALLVDVSSPPKAARSLVNAITTIKQHAWDVVIFPEGARYTDGAVHEFYSGFIKLARATDRPIVPIKITGVNKVYPPKTWLVRSAPITVTLGPVFVLNPQETDDEFKQRIYAWFVE